MQNIIYVIFAFIVIPLIFTLAFLEKHSRRTMLFLISGICLCLAAANINSFLLVKMKVGYFYYSSTISPVVEEFLKALPTVFYVFIIKKTDRYDEGVTLGLASGVGFALFENIVIYCQNNMTGTLLWAVSRGIGTGLMHTLCSGAFAYGCCFIKHHRYGANFLLVSVLFCTIIYHGMYNCMVQSEVMVTIGIFLPLLSYGLLMILYYRTRKIIAMRKLKEVNASENT